MNVRPFLPLALFFGVAFSSVAVGQLTITTTSLPAGTQAVSYSQTLQVTGATSSGLDWAIPASSSLPPGLFLDSGGNIFGTPTQPGTFNFTVQVTDFGAQPPPTASAQLSITINQNLVITTTSPLPNGTINVPYTFALVATANGSSPPFNWSLNEGSSLPPGINLDSTGALSGTPTQIGTFSFTVTVETSIIESILTDQRTFSLTIVPPVSITTTTLPAGQLNSAYSAQLAATGGSGQFLWSATGSLPPGISLSSGGLLAGTPTAAGSFGFTVIAASTSNGVQVTGQRALTLQVNLPAVSVVTASLPAGQLNSAYSVQLAATGGTGQFQWSVTGSLPSGLSLSSGGLLAGTPTAVGSFGFTVIATSTSNSVQVTGQRALTLQVNLPGVSVVTASLPAGQLNSAYSAQLAATGGSGQFQWSVTGSLPPGLSLSSGGLLAGTPTAAGAFGFTVVATSTSNGVQSTGQRALTLQVNLPGVSVVTASLPAGQMNSAYGVQLTATGGTGQFQWSVSGSLPPGLTVSSGGLLAGTPTAVGSFGFTVIATSTSNGVQVTGQRALTLQVNVPPVSVVTTSLPSGQLNSAYSVQLAATGGFGQYQWSVGGSLPPGIALNSGGLLAGTPTAVGSFGFTVTVTSTSNGVQVTAQQALTLQINLPPLSVLTTSLPSGRLNSAYSAQLAATGGSGQYQWSATGSLPPGIALSSGGLLAGTPTTFGSYAFTAIVTSASNGVQVTAQRALTLQITVPPLSVVTSSLPGGVPGTAYSAQLAATGGLSPYHWSLSAGSLPAGLQLSQEGLITGTPSAESTATFFVQATDSTLQTAVGQLSISVAYPALTLAGTLPSGSVNAAYSAAVQASGGSGKYTFSLAGGSLPPGLTFSASGAVSGTPTTTGTYPVTIQVNDTSGKSASGAFSILIKAQSLGVAIQVLPTGTVGVAYSASLAAVGGASPYSFAVSGLPPGLSMTPTGQISGTPTTKGTYTLTLTITDNTGATAPASVAITIGVAPLTISGAAPDAQVGVAVTGKLTVSGGTPPYTCSLARGTLPAGVAFNADCTFSGIPTTLGTSSFTVQASDKDGTTASDALTMTVVVPPIVIAPTLPAGTVGAAYSQTLTATGGLGTLTWSAGSGLPDGITLASTGVVSGTALSAGTFSFTATARDPIGTSASRTVSVTFSLPPTPAASFTGLGGTVGPAMQPAFQVQLANAYPVALTGTLTLTFAGDDGTDDPSVQFSTGGRTLAFTVAANSTTATFSASSVALATGTSAGLITLTAHFQAAGQDVTPNPAPTQTIRIGPLAPVISAVTATRSGTTVTVVVTGYATSKQVTTAAFTFNPATGANFQTTILSVTVSSTFTAYYASSAASGFGSQFKFTQTFTVSGDPAAVVSVGVVLTNSVGSSAAVSANLQ